MSRLHAILDDYLAMRRALGFRLERAGTLLPGFLAFLEKADSPVITTALALAWAKQPTKATRNWWARRLDMIRVFARYVRTRDPRTEIPPYDLLPRTRGRPQPVIYADAEVIALIDATGRVRDPFRAHTYKTLIGLLAASGMRVGEAIALDRSDLDPQEQVLTIRTGKFGKSRLVPLHSTVVHALERYAGARDRRFRGRSTSPALFSSPGGTRLVYKNVHATFFRLVDQAGLANRKPRRPRIHDLRHTFAVRTLIGFYLAGLDVERQLPFLSTYLGHVHPSDTYWYLSAVPELLDIAAKRLEETMGDLP